MKGAAVIAVALLASLSCNGAGSVGSESHVARDGHMLAAAKRLSRTTSYGDHIIVTISDWDYRPLLLNWMVHMLFLNISEYIVLCLDSRTYDLVGAWHDGGHGILVPEYHERLEIFRFRHTMVRTLLRRGYSVVLVDNDCVWLKNAMHWILPAHGQADILAQMGFAPNGTFYRQGVTACAGFLVLFPTDRTRHFYDLYVDGLGPNVDDQWHLNAMLEKYNAFNFKSNKTTYFHSQMEIIISQPPLMHGEFCIRLGLLPYYKFPRMNDLRVYKHDDPVVWHNTKNWSVPKPEGPKINRSRDKQWLVNGKLENVTWKNVSINKAMVRKSAMKRAAVFAIANTPWELLRAHSELQNYFACIDVKSLHNTRVDKVYHAGSRMSPTQAHNNDNNGKDDFILEDTFSVWRCGSYKAI